MFIAAYKGKTACLVVCDVASLYIYVRPLADKTAKTTASAFETVLIEANSKLPEGVTSVPYEVQVPGHWCKSVSRA